MSTLSIKTRCEGDVGIISVSGKMLGDAETDKLHEEVKELITQGFKKQIIDLSKVERINSSGLGTIMASFISLKNATGELRIVGLREGLKSLFVITKMDTVIAIFDDINEALVD